MRTGWHSPDLDGIYCHNHWYTNISWSDTKSIHGSWQTGMVRHSHTP
jgi:hypothetical protein